MHTPHHTDARRRLHEARDQDRAGDPRRTAEPRSWRGDEDRGPGDFERGEAAAGPAGDRDLEWRERRSWYGAPVGGRYDPDYRQPTGQGGMMNAGAQEEPGSPLFYGQSGWRPGDPNAEPRYGEGRANRGYEDWATRSHAPGAQIWREPEPERRESAGGRHDFEPDYLHWRDAQMRNLDRDYLAWREERRQKFSQDFDDWRSRRDTARAGDDSPETENPNVGDVADGGTGGGDDESKKR